MLKVWLKNNKVILIFNHDKYVYKYIFFSDEEASLAKLMASTGRDEN